MVGAHPQPRTTPAGDPERVGRRASWPASRHHRPVHRRGLGPGLLAILAATAACSASDTGTGHPGSFTTVTQALAPPGSTVRSATVLPALRTHNPVVSVRPSTSLVDGQRIQVTVSGFGQGGKFFLSECATPADANSAGCGQQLASQPFGVTDASGKGSHGFIVRTSAGTTRNSTGFQRCTDLCVLVATVGVGFGYTYVPLRFAKA